jgi:hypothetical protein
MDIVVALSNRSRPFPHQIPLIIIGLNLKTLSFLPSRFNILTLNRVSCVAQAAARVPSQVRSCGIYGVQSGTGAGFPRALPFLLPILIPQPAPHSASSIIRAWYSRPNSGQRAKWTQAHPTSRNLKKKYAKPIEPRNHTA